MNSYLYSVTIHTEKAESGNNTLLDFEVVAKSLEELKSKIKVIVGEFKLIEIDDIYLLRDDPS